MTTLNKGMLVVALGAVLTGFSAAGASAAVACTGNVCWHTHERYAYPPEARVTIHRDGWRWGPREHYSWREHEGRGYWRGDDWIDR
jgi:hypothetical protein